MFYVNYISFKNDPAKSKNVALLISMTIAGLLIYFTHKSLINFCIGKNLEVFEYLFVLLFVYSIVNVVIAFKMDGENSSQSETVIVDKKETKIFEKNNNLKRAANGGILDDFIFDKTVYYDINQQRGSIIPDFGNEGLEYEEDLEDKTENQNEFNFENFGQDQTNTHENISFNHDPEDETTINNEENLNEQPLDKMAKRELLKNELYKNSLGK